MAKSIPVKTNDSIIYHIELVHDFSMLPAFLQGLGYGHSQKNLHCDRFQRCAFVCEGRTGSVEKRV